MLCSYFWVPFKVLVLPFKRFLGPRYRWDHHILNTGLYAQAAWEGPPICATSNRDWGWGREGGPSLWGYYGTSSLGTKSVSSLYVFLAFPAGSAGFMACLCCLYCLLLPGCHFLLCAILFFTSVAASFMTTLILLALIQGFTTDFNAADHLLLLFFYRLQFLSWLVLSCCTVSHLGHPHVWGRESTNTPTTYMWNAGLSIWSDFIMKQKWMGWIFIHGNM